MARSRRTLLAGVVLAVLAGLALAGRQGSGADDAVAERPARAANQARPAPTAGTPVVLAFAGDVHFESPIRERMAVDPGAVLATIAPVLRRADVAVVNLETAVTAGGAAVAKQYVFRAPPSAFTALAAGGVHVASMANNHGMDFGESGLRDSLAAARRAHFPVIGIGLDDRRAYAPYRVRVGGQRIAIIGATQVLDDELIAAWTAGPHKPGLASAKDAPRLLRAVREARATSDTVVVFLHWGVERVGCATRRQRRLARQLVAAGADVVVGGHAHRLLGTGRLAKALVSYGLGNFVWYGSSELSVRTGVLLVTVSGRRVESYRWEPARIVDGSPRPLAGGERSRAIRAWRALRACSGLRP